MTGVTTVLVGGLAVAGLLAVSAFFSSTETAIFSLSPEWIGERAATGDERARVLQELRDDPHRLLVTILVGNNVVNVAISSIVTVLLAQYVTGGLAVTVATLVASSLVLVCGEIVPKSYGLGNARRWALTAAGPVTVVERLLYPVVVAFDAVTRRIAAAIGGDGDIEEPLVGE